MALVKYKSHENMKYRGKQNTSCAVEILIFPDRSYQESANGLRGRNIAFLAFNSSISFAA